jgi:hypothetical protein
MSCTNDPARQKKIDALGPEPGDVPQGELHRPGQPCVLCHSDGGPADKTKFAIAGTIFDSNKSDGKGLSNVRVLFIDASSATREVTTNDAGNFFILQTEWPDLTFPFRTGIASGANTAKMQSTINREPSCNFCHKPAAGNNAALPDEDSRESIGPIFISGGGK